MLARLADLPCVAELAVDRSGKWLRVGTTTDELDECVRTVSTWLEREGTFVERVVESADVERWYRPDEVRELSAAEAAVLGAEAAAAIVPPPDAATLEAVRDVVATRLHETFVTHHLERGERLPLHATVERMLVDVGRSLTPEQLDSLERHLASALDL